MKSALGIGAALLVGAICLYAPSCVVQLDRNESLYFATQQSDIGQMKILISKGANVNFDFEGDSILSAAVHSRSIEAVKLLLDNGADPNSTGGSYRLPVVEQARHLAEIRALLIKAGAKH